MIDYSVAPFEVVRDYDKCVNCRVCERQCSNEVHHYEEGFGKMISDSTKCVDCQRCVCLCPTKPSRSCQIRIASAPMPTGSRNI